MKLTVLGAPAQHNEAAPQGISVRYSPKKNCTVVTCDADVVTLGVAITVLNKLYESALQDIDNDAANEIKTVMRKVALEFE